MSASKNKVPGHKRAKVLHGVRVVCECGWESANWLGKGAYRQAHGEYHMHLDEAHDKLKKQA